MVIVMFSWLTLRLGKIKEWVDANGKEPMVPFCGVLETKVFVIFPVALILGSYLK